MKHNFFAVTLAFSLLPWSAASIASDIPESVQNGGLLIDLNFLRSDDDGGEDIPLSLEMFETPGDALTDNTRKAVTGEVSLTEVSRIAAPKPAIIATPAAAPKPAALPATIAKTDAAQPVATAKTPVATAQTPLPLPVKLVEAAATEEKTATDSADEAFEAIVEAMTPKEPVEPLKKNRFTFYLSDAVAFAQLETSTSRFKLDNGRLHVASIYSEERDSVIHGGISLDASFTKSFRLSFGARAYIALLSMENVDAFATAVGTEAAYRLPFKALPLEFSASLYYAPDILTFGAGDRAIDTQVDITMPFRSHSALFAGLRFLQIDTRPEDAEVDNRLHIGFRWDFD
ncbi:MAG: hypothetical protein AAF404_11085 [Pseudomonadota bacterium]